MSEIKKPGQSSEELRDFQEGEFPAEQIVRPYDTAEGIKIDDEIAKVVPRDELNRVLAHVEDLLVGSGDVEAAVVSLIQEKVVALATISFLSQCYDNGTRPDNRRLADRISFVEESKGGALLSMFGLGPEVQDEEK